jgi:hypothetical protein
VKPRATVARIVTATILSALAGLGAVTIAAAPAAAASSGALVGTFELTAGHCSGGSVAGTYIQMILPSGNVNGPYMSNSDSSCSNQAYTLMSPGTDGGLVTGEYQQSPSPAFDAHGDALAKRITAPAQYEGTAFATATSPVDPQTKKSVPVPSIANHNGTLTGNVQSFAVTWNNQNFNQGSPKPDGTYPGASKPVSGTYDASTGAFTLDWISQVVGGPFDKFSCHWHLSGTFVPASSSTTSGTTGHKSSAGSTTSHHTTTNGGTSTGSTTTSGSATTSKSARTGSSGSSPTGTAKAPSSAQAASGTSAGGVAPQLANQAASTSTVSKQTWHVTWWVLAVAIALAVLGFGALAVLARRIRAATAAPAAGPDSVVTP